HLGKKTRIISTKRRLSMTRKTKKTEKTASKASHKPADGKSPAKHSTSKHAGAKTAPGRASSRTPANTATNAPGRHAGQPGDAPKAGGKPATRKPAAADMANSPAPARGAGRSRAARKAAIAHAGAGGQSSTIQTSAIRLADPFHAREAQQYENPLPSREYVLQILTERGVPLPFSELAGALDIAPHELEHFDRRLRAMERDGQIVRNRRDAYLLPAKARSEEQRLNSSHVKSSY